MGYKSFFTPFIFLLTLDLFVNCRSSVSEIEPQNNFRKTAQEMKSGQIFEGSFYSQGQADIDYIFYRVDKGSMIRGELSGMLKGIDSEILLFRQSEKDPFKIINDKGSSLSEEFGPIDVEPPGIVLAIRPRNRVNHIEAKDNLYQFRAEILSANSLLEHEPNDDFSTATELTDDKIYGYYSNIFSETGNK